MAVFVCRTKDKKTSRWSEFQDTFLIASAECKTDSEEILEGSSISFLDEGYSRLVASKSIQVYEENKGGVKSYSSTLMGEEAADEVVDAAVNVDAPVAESPAVVVAASEGDAIPLVEAADVLVDADVVAETNKLAVGEPIVLQCFLASDLKQYMLNQGRARFASCWCPYCDLSHAKWQNKNHEKGRPWTIARLNRHVENIQNKTDPNKILGCGKRPIFQAIDVCNQIPPILHCELGLGNKIGGQLKDEVQAACEKWTNRYVQLETRYAQMCHDHNQLEKWQKAFDVSEHITEVELTKKSKINPLSPPERRELKAIQKRLATINENLEKHKSASGEENREYEKWMKKLEDFNQKKKGERGSELLAKSKTTIMTAGELDELTRLRAKADALKRNLENRKREMVQLKKDLDEERKEKENTKEEGQPIRAAVEDVFAANGINQAAYFGGRCRAPLVDFW